jgi:hypothetical protein
MSEMGIEGFVRLHSIGAGLQYGAATLWAGVKFYPKLLKESFSNKQEVVRALKEC